MSKIKIGTTVYSTTEFRQKKIDLKTAYAIYEMENERLLPNICDRNLEIPLISQNELKEMCNKIIPDALHKLRRLLYNPNDVTQSNSYENMLFKELSHLMREYLLQEDINATDYQDVFNKFASKFKVEKFDANDFISGLRRQSIIESCNNIVDMLAKGIYDITEEKDVEKEIEEGKNEMSRKSARAIIMKDDEFILIHRIKEKDGKKYEYYVFPGGGLEEGETYEEAVKREVFEELGITVNPQKRLYRLEEDNRDEMFILCQYLEGKIGTGKGPEFTSSEYSDRGLYIPETIPMDKFKEINVLESIKKALIKDVENNGKLENARFQDLSDMER